MRTLTDGISILERRTKKTHNGARVRNRLFVQCGKERYSIGADTALDGRLHGNPPPQSQRLATFLRTRVRYDFGSLHSLLTITKRR